MISASIRNFPLQHRKVLEIESNQKVKSADINVMRSKDRLIPFCASVSAAKIPNNQPISPQRVI